MDMNKIKKELSKSGTWSARDFTLWARPTIKALVQYVQNLQVEVETLESQVKNMSSLSGETDSEESETWTDTDSPLEEPTDD